MKTKPENKNKTPSKNEGVKTRQVKKNNYHIEY